MIAYPRFPHELVPPVERRAAERCAPFRDLPERARKDLASTAVALTQGHSRQAIEYWLAALDEAETHPAAYIQPTIDDPGWAPINRGPSPGAWARNALDAYARIRTARVALGRCTETTPHSQFHVHPLDPAFLDRAEKLAEAILQEARERLEDYAARLQGDRSRRDWRKYAEDALFDMAREHGLSGREAATVACQLLLAAAEGLPRESEAVMKKRAEATRKRAERRKRSERPGLEPGC